MYRQRRCAKLALTLLFIHDKSYQMRMGGLGLCLCCKEDKLLTEHQDKEIKNPVLLCRDCHSVIEEYVKLIKKYSHLVLKDANA